MQDDHKEAELKRPRKAGRDEGGNWEEEGEGREEAVEVSLCAADE